MPVETTARPLRRDAALNRERLLDAATRVFAAGGLDAGVDEVAREAGVGMGTLYRRFPTKDALIGELVRGLLVDMITLGRQALSVAGGGGLERFLEQACAEQLTQRGCVARLWSDPETTALKAEVRTIIADLLVDAQQHGRVRPDANLGDIDLIFWSLRGVLEATRHVQTPAWRRLVAIMIAGLRPSAAVLSEPSISPQDIDLIRRSNT